MKTIMFIIAALAIAAAAGIAVAGPGTRLGLWDYGTGLSVMYGLKLPAIAAAGLAFVSFVTALFRARGLAVLMFVAAAAAGGAAIVPVMFDQRVAANPFIHDITTDFGNPPRIVAGAAFPRDNPAEYVGKEMAPRSNLTIAEAQQAAFPDIGPTVVDLRVEEAVEHVRIILEEMNMDILREGSSDASSTIEAAYTSMWFGFTDDFVLRLTPEGETTRIDVRSKSRVGVSDLGANAQRTRDFFSKLQAQLAS